MILIDKKALVAGVIIPLDENGIPLDRPWLFPVKETVTISEARELYVNGEIGG